MGYKGVINNHVFLASVNREMVFGHSKKKKKYNTFTVDMLANWT